YEGTIEITYPDGSSVIVEIPVTVKDKVDWVDINPIPTIGEDQILPEVVHKGEEADLTDNIINLPEGSTVEVVTPVDTDQVGEQTGEVKVTFPDGSSVIVEIPVTVKDKVDWVDINPIPTIGEDQILPEVVHKGEEADLTDNIINLPEGSTVEVVTPVDTDQVGEQTGKVKVTFPDGSSVIIEIPVTIKDNNNLSSTNKQYPVVLDVVRKNKNIDLSNATLKEDSIISKTDNKVLPQTGENDNSFFSILGMTLISVSSLLFGLFRKKEEK
ncbi:LPXTG cell wall anchor domain-containing protein, partial [Enterococcus faecalis]